MKATDLIIRLQNLIEQVGDTEVDLYMEDVDGTKCGVDDINEVEIATDYEGTKSIYIAHRVEEENVDYDS